MTSPVLLLAVSAVLGTTCACTERSKALVLPSDLGGGALVIFEDDPEAPLLLTEPNDVVQIEGVSNRTYVASLGVKVEALLLEPGWYPATHEGREVPSFESTFLVDTDQFVPVDAERAQTALMGRRLPHIDVHVCVLSGRCLLDAGTRDERCFECPLPTVLGPEAPRLTCPDGWPVVAGGVLGGCALDLPARAVCTASTEQFYGNAGCTAIGDECPDGLWPSDLPAGAIRVRDSLELAAAVATATSGAVLALARGEYAADSLVVERDLTVRGACAAGTVLTVSSSAAAAFRPTVYVIGALTLSNVTVRGGPYSAAVVASDGSTVAMQRVLIEQANYGVRVDRASVLLRESVVRDTAYYGAHLVGGSMTIVNSVFDGGINEGLFLEHGATATMHRTVVRDYRALLNSGDICTGINAVDADLELHEVLIEDVAGMGLWTTGASVDAVGLAVRNIVRGDDPGFGNAVVADSGSIYSMRGVSLSDIVAGLLVRSASLAVDGLVVRGVEENALNASEAHVVARNVFAEGGKIAILGSDAEVQLEDVAVHGAIQALYVESARRTELRRVIVEQTSGEQAVRLNGRPFQVSNVHLEDVLVSKSAGGGISLSASDMLAERLAVVTFRDSALALEDGQIVMRHIRFEDGISPTGRALRMSYPTNFSMEDFSIARIRGTAIYLEPPQSLARRGEFLLRRGRIDTAEVGVHSAWPDLELRSLLNEVSYLNVAVPLEQGLP